NQLRIDTSIGITTFPADGANADRLLRNADLALRRAKREGRGQYRVYSRDMDQEVRAALSLENGLRQAIDNGNLDLFYQPTFALTDGSIQGVEALIRWPRPSGGYLSPASFIQLAEMSGLIVPLGACNLRPACRQ